MTWKMDSDERNILIGYSNGDKESFILTGSPYFVDKSTNISKSGLGILTSDDGVGIEANHNVLLIWRFHICYIDTTLMILIPFNG